MAFSGYGPDACIVTHVIARNRPHADSRPRHRELTPELTSGQARRARLWHLAAALVFYAGFWLEACVIGRFWTDLRDHWCTSGFHSSPEQELKDRVEEIQTRFFDTRNLAMDALMDLIHDIKAAKVSGATDVDLAPARDFQCKAQFYIDFLVSENSMGFHADQYAVKSLAEAINFGRLGQLALRQKLIMKASETAGGK